MRRKILGALSAAALCATAILAGGATAHANTNTEQYLNFASGWCATVTGFNPGDHIVLGVCNDNAASQQFHLVSESNNTFQIVSNDNGLCTTYSSPEGAPDGGWMVSGNCVDAISQRFEYYDTGTGGLMYWLPGQYDSHQANVAFDDANYVLKAYNKIDGSYFCTTCDQQRWSELYLG